MAAAPSPGWDSAILPGMPKRLSGKRAIRPSIAIVGAGSLASALAFALHNAGYVIDEIVSRGRVASLQKARRLAAEVDCGGEALLSPRFIR
jgi:hypothetical protein